MQIKSLVFDLDDTLYCETDFVLSGFKAVDQWLCQRYHFYGFYSCAHHLFNMGERKFIFNKSLELLNVTFNQNEILELVEVYRSHDPVIQLFDDAKWVLDSINYTTKLGLITDGYLMTQKNKVKALNIEERFHTIIYSDSFGRDNWKPSIVPYQNASIGLQCLHNECVYIGDNLSKDFITAKKLGWKTVHINRLDGIYSNSKVDPDYQAHYQINNLRELLGISDLIHLFKSELFLERKGLVSDFKSKE